MSDVPAFTDLEEGLFGPDGTQVLRDTAGRLIALRADVSARIADGLAPELAAPATLALAAISSASRIVSHLKSSGE